MLMLGSEGECAYAVAHSDTGVCAIRRRMVERERVIAGTGLQHTCLTCICCMLLYAIWRDARLRSMRPAPARLHVFAPPCHMRRAPRLPSTTTNALSLSVLTSTACKHLHPVSSPHKTFSHPLPYLTLPLFHHPHTPHPRLTIPASQTQPPTPRTNQTNTHQSSTWAR